MNLININSKVTMKKNLLLLLTVIFAINFTSCNDDDDYTPLIPPSDISVTYGSDNDNKLTLSYSDVIVSGKQIKFATTDGKTASLTLMDILPGKAEATLENIALTEGEGEYIFSGTSPVARSTEYSVAYSGTVKKGEMTLKLNVTVPDPQGWAKTYTLGEYKTGEFVMGETTYPAWVLNSALYASCTFEDAELGETYAMLFKGLGGLVLPQVLKSVTLATDGNICAQYYSGEIQIDQNLIFPMLGGQAPSEEVVNALIPTSGEISSPKNLAYWFEKDGKLYVKLNITAIVAQAMSESGTGGGDETLATIIATVLNGNASTIKQLLSQFTGLDFSEISDASFEMLLDWIKNGVPLNVAKAESGHTYMYLDRTAFDPIFRDTETPADDPSNIGAKSDLLKLWKLLSDAGIIPEDAQLAILLLGGLLQEWPTNTVFNIGLDLK